MADFARRSQGRLYLVSKFHPRANRYPPPPRLTDKKPKGRPRKKGAKLLSPPTVVMRSPHQRCNVAWYGGGRRDVEVVSGCGHWYKGGAGLVEVRWVYVHDRTGMHRHEYFYTTDMGRTPAEIVEAYAAGWNIEPPFAEMRSYLVLETTRGWQQEELGPLVQSELDRSLDIRHKGERWFKGQAQRHTRVRPDTPIGLAIVAQRQAELAVELFDGQLVLRLLQLQLGDLPLIILDGQRQRDAEFFHFFDALERIAAPLQTGVEQVGLGLGAGELIVPLQRRSCRLVAALQGAVQQERFLELALFPLFFCLASTPTRRLGLLLSELSALIIEAIGQGGVLGGQALTQERSKGAISIRDRQIV